MATPTAATKKALRRELAEAGINDPFSMLADCISRNRELEAEVKHLRMTLQASPKELKVRRHLHGGARCLQCG